MRQTLASIRRSIRSDWDSIVQRSGVNPSAAEWLPAKPTLLGGSEKTAKSHIDGVRTAVVYLAPSDLSGRNTCPWATPECAAACLGHNAGRMVYDSVRRSQIWKTALYFGARELFRQLLTLEVAAFERKAVRDGMIPAVRVDGTSDLDPAGDSVRAMFPNVRWYDYTKSVKRALRSLETSHDVTFSYSGHNDAEALEVLQAGGRVAVVFDTATPSDFPATWHGFDVVDGDRSDARFLEGNVVVGLTFKTARNRSDATATAGAFVRPCVDPRQMLQVA